jgi:hypothetical protein
MSERNSKQKATRPKFIKKSISYPAELAPFIKQRIAEPKFRSQLSTYLTFLVAWDKERVDAAA